MPKIETAISRIYAKEVEEMVRRACSGTLWFPAVSLCRELMPAATFVELAPWIVLVQCSL